jgi:hypothetical protein
MNRKLCVNGWVGVIALCAGCSGERLDLGETGASGQGGAWGHGGTAGSSGQAESGQGGAAGSSGSGSGGWGASGGGSSGAGEGGAACEPRETDDPNLLRYLVQPEWPDSEECVPGTLPNLEGIWEGLVQGEPLGPFSGHEVTIEIVGSNATGQPCGSIRFGADTELPPPGDPDDFYPPGAEEVLHSDPFGLGPSLVGPLEGSAYTIQEASVDGARLNWDVAIEEPYRGWCALQEPVPSELVTQDCFNCIGEESGETSWSVGGSSCSLAGKSLSCFRLGMCLNGLCWCSADECEARNITRLSFDILLDDDEMQGVVGDRALFLERKE